MLRFRIRRVTYRDASKPKRLRTIEHVDAHSDPHLGLDRAFPEVPKKVLMRNAA